MLFEGRVTGIEPAMMEPQPIALTTWPHPPNYLDNRLPRIV